VGERYRRLKKRRGSKRAALAVGHSILVIYYQMMKTGEEYQEKGEAFFPQADRGKIEHRLIHRLERPGYQVTRQPQPVAGTHSERLRSVNSQHCHTWQRQGRFLPFLPLFSEDVGGEVENYAHCEFTFVRF
jgi:hypothetical protein